VFDVEVLKESFIMEALVNFSYQSGQPQVGLDWRERSQASAPLASRCVGESGGPCLC
jgi:hypothetical protein